MNVIEKPTLNDNIQRIVDIINSWTEEERSIVIINKINEIINNLSEIQIDKLSKIDFDDFIKNGDFLGSWQGIEKPTLSDEGLASTVEKLVKDLLTTNNDVVDLDSKVDSNYSLLSEKIDNITLNKNKKFIFIGDSYMSPLINWADESARLLGLSTSQYVKRNYGGSGFVCTNEGNNFITLLSSINNDDLVTDIVVCGGANDALQNRNDLINAISSFCTIAKNKFKNSRVHIGFIGRVLESENTYQYGECVNAYMECRKFGANYLQGVENSAHHFQATLQDNVHLTEFGQQIVGQAIFTAIKNGSVKINYPRSTIAIKESVTIYNIVTDGICNIFSNGSYTCVPSSTPSDYLDVCMLNNNYVIGNKYQQTFSVLVYVDGVMKHGNLFLDGNRLRLRISDSVTTSNNVKLAQFSISMPVIYN